MRFDAHSESAWQPIELSKELPVVLVQFVSGFVEAARGPTAIALLTG